EYHGPHYDVPPMQMHPTPASPVPIYVGGESPPAIRRAATLGDGWIGAGPYTPEDANGHLDNLARARAAAGRAGEPFTIYPALLAEPDVDLYRRFEDAGVTDMVCAPWMLAEMKEGRDYRSSLDAKLAASEEFATNVIAKMA